MESPFPGLTQTPASRSSRLVVVVVCCLFLSLFVGPLSVGAFEGSGSQSDTVEIDAELEDANGTVTVVLRLEEPELSSLDDDVEAHLENRTERMQEPILEYANTTAGVALEETFWVTNAVVLEVDTEEVDLETFAQFDLVTSIHPNTIIPPPEPLAVSEADITQSSSTTDGISMIGAPGLWEKYETRGEGVRVAVLDTGVDASHPDIDLHTEDPTDPSYPGGWQSFDANGSAVSDSVPNDPDGHGTHVSGTVAGGNTTGTAIGVAPEATLLHGQVLTSEGATFAQIIAGLEWAVDSDADVITLSLGADGYVDLFIDPIHTVESTGTIVVSAIGNDGVGTSGSPGNIYGSMSVGAVDGSGTVAAFSGGETISRDEWSNPGEEWPETYVVPSVVAPGVNVASAVPGGYAQLSGTSMSTPHVAGTVALMQAVEPDASPETVKRSLRDTAWKPADAPNRTDHRYGDGVIDAEAATSTLVVTMANGTELDESTADATDGPPVHEERTGAHDRPEQPDDSSEPAPVYPDDDPQDEGNGTETDDSSRAIDTGEVEGPVDPDERVPSPPMGLGAVIPLLTITVAVLALGLGVRLRS